jgi:NAD(P)-dependent dehydrogenase (short-subunit alcohol dehydrogenase family)
MQGRVCVITGASSGIGRAVAMGLARLGASVVLVCRNRERAMAAQTALREATGNKTIDFY